MSTTRIPRFGRVLAGVAGLSLLLAACGGSSYSREDAIADLVADDIDQEMAECIVDEVEDEFGIEKLESSDDVTEEDEAKLLEIFTECFLGE
ncbi:MAG: hypothetical protein GY713_10530 [Actinomycetia bacterium]|nr:hypothetical protein [Actinomycetes bacterium]